MQVLGPSPPTIIARCVHSAKGGTRSAPCPHCVHPWVSMLQSLFAFAIWPMPLHEKPLDSVDNSCTRAFPLRQKDEYGIASNAVTVLIPDLVESVALSTPNLLSHFHRILDSGRPSLLRRSPQGTLSAEIRNHHRPIFLASNHRTVCTCR